MSSGFIGRIANLIIIYNNFSSRVICCGAIANGMEWFRDDLANGEREISGEIDQDLSTPNVGEEGVEGGGDDDATVRKRISLESTNNSTILASLTEFEELLTFDVERGFTGSLSLKSSRVFRLAAASRPKSFQFR